MPARYYGRVDPARRNLQRLTPDQIPAVQKELSDQEEILVRKAELEYKAKAKAIASGLIALGFDRVLDVVGTLENPDVVANLVAFTVPNNQIAMIDQIGVYYSDPTVAACIAIGWRIIVNVTEVPNIQVNNFIYRFSSIGDVMEPMKVRPFYVQAGQTVSIQIDPLSNKINAFDEHLTMMGRLSGEIYRPVSPDLLVVGV